MLMLQITCTEIAARSLVLAKGRAICVAQQGQANMMTTCMSAQMVQDMSVAHQVTRIAAVHVVKL